MGLPHALRGNEVVATSQTLFCERFAQRLADRAAPLGFRVWLADENGTSGDAAERMTSSGVTQARQGRQLDAVAAALILERYFAAQGGIPQLVAPAAGLVRLPPGQRGHELALAWLGESEGAARGGRGTGILPQPPPQRSVSELEAADAAMPPKPPPRSVPLRLLRREPPAVSRRDLWEQGGL